jgi:hypothetical protein
LLSRISAAITYSAWWKGIEQAKARGNKKAVSKRFFACKLLKRKTGAQAASRFCVSRILKGQAETKKNTGLIPHSALMGVRQKYGKVEKLQYK